MKESKLREVSVLYSSPKSSVKTVIKDMEPSNKIDIQLEEILKEKLEVTK
jgi:hypothetical protein